MDALQKSMEALAKEFNERMAEFQSSLVNTAVDKPTTVATLSAEFGSFRTFVAIALDSLQKQATMLSQQQDSFEMRTRRKMLLIHGVPESNKEDTPAVVAKIVSEDMGVVDFTSSDISRSHRLGKSSNNKHRTILVKFSSLGLKEKVWFAKSGLRGSGVTLSEFLTKPRHNAFMLARQHFGMTKAWTRDGMIHIATPDGVRHRVSTPEEVKKLASAFPRDTEAVDAVVSNEEAASDVVVVPCKPASAAAKAAPRTKRGPKK